MANKVAKIKELSTKTLNRLTQPDNFLAYLQTASHMYKYPFYDSLLIHAQKADATAVASYELWNGKMNRYINSGTKGIALLRTNSRVSRLKYVFDLSDTNGEKVPNLWQYKPEYEERISFELAEEFWQERGATLEITVDNIVKETLENNIEEMVKELHYNTEDSFLEDIDELNIKVWFRGILEDSIKTVVLLRCGYTLNDIHSDHEFLGLENFNTEDTMVCLGQTISTYSEEILRSIEKSVKKIDKELQTERRLDNERNNDVDGRDGNPIRGNQRTGLEEADTRTNGTERASTRQIGDDAQDISREKSSNSIFSHVTQGEPIQDLLQQRSSSTETNRSNDSTNETNREQSSNVANTIRGNRESSDTGNDTEQIKQADIEHVLLQGTMFKDGKQKIINFFFQKTDSTQRAEFIQGAYGVGGDSITYEPNRFGFYSYDKNGMTIERGEQYQKAIHLTWREVAHRIDSLINDERYFESRQDGEILIKPSPPPQPPTLIDLAEEKNNEPQFNIDEVEVEANDDASFFMPEDKEKSQDVNQETHDTSDLIESDVLLKKIKIGATKNYIITDNQLGVGGAKEKYQRNIAAIKLLKTIENENRTATQEEQVILSQYVGFGGIADVFDANKANWQKEYNELKERLSPSEYDMARASSLSSFYTQPIVIRSMYDALINMGFSKGNILEPSMGIGNFVGCMPEYLQSSNVYGVELDSLTGQIAQQLYPNANIQIAGFEKTLFQDNFFDVAVGNVPFGDFSVSDSRYNKQKFLIHDFFFAKALDKVRAGGIVAFITSKGTLDKANSKVRQYLAQRAELIGAIRLPNTAFHVNAGTKVTSDIIFLQKRDSIQDITPSWVDTGHDQNNIPINQYFIDNPHMILGSMEKVTGRFGEETVCLPDESSSLEQQLQTAIRYLNADIRLDNEFDIEEPEQENTTIPADPNVKNYSFTIKDDTIYFRENSIMTVVEVGDTAEQRIRGMIGIRTALQKVIDYQVEGYSNHEIQQAQTELNRVYDHFVDSHGRINTRGNSLAFREDSSYYLLSSLELLDDQQEFKAKADIFTKQTIRPVREITHADTSIEALTLSLSQKGRIDVGYMAALTGKEPTTVINDLKGIIFKDPLSNMANIFEGWKNADEYLSGNVRQKLSIAKTYCQHELVSHNVQALEKVQPKDLTFDEIDVKLGTVWIPTSDYNDFIHETLQTPNYFRYDIEVSYSEITSNWNISNKSMNRSSIRANDTFGTKRKSAYHIIEDSLNQRCPNVYDRIEDENGNMKSVKNKNETLLATQKQTLLQEEFKTWIWKEPERRERLTKYYNKHYNNIRPREYDGSHLIFEGMNPSINLRPHQKSAIARQLYGGNSLLAHVVGAGKSFTMIAGAMEKKRLGLTSKNMFVVPNHLTEQMATEILRLYPSANVLVTTKKDFQTKNRKRFCSKIATGDYDIVVIGHSQFEKIPLSIEWQTRIINEQIEEIVNGIEQLKHEDGQRFNIKQMESTKKKLEVRLDRLNKNERKDDVVTFEQLGVDGLYVDESHMYKNLFMYTKMNNVAGIQQTEAQKSTDMFMKCQYMDEITDGTGICFATGTPISNSMVEMYTVQRYLQMNDLKSKRLHHFDSWASVFGETQTAFELSVDGNGFKTKTRFNKFHNLPELMNMFKEVADIQTADMLKLPIPELKTGEVQTVLIKPTEIQKKLIVGLGERADKIDKKMVTPDVDNMLNIVRC